MKPKLKRAKKTKPSAPVAATAPRRHEDWAARLFAFVEHHRRQPFKWGERDCCMFVCAGILTTTGLDPAAKLFRGKYRDAVGAARLLKKHGGVEAIAASVCAEHGFPEVRVAMAQRGDVVLIDVDEAGHPAKGAARSALGLCIGGQSVFPGPDGLKFVGVGECRRAWAVARPVAEAGRIG
jgi:hypothetical protein